MRTDENPAPKPAKDTNWQCAYCKQWHPVAILARDCERSH